MKAVIIGSGTGAVFAALAIRKRDSCAEIAVIDRKNFELLHPCGLPYMLGGELEDSSLLKGELPDLGLKKFIAHSAEKILIGEKKVLARNLLTGEALAIGYDKLIIATGAGSLVPKIEGAGRLFGKGVHKLASWEDASQIMEALPGKKTATVVGAGAIGLELAYSLCKRGLDVTVVEAKQRVLPRSLDEDMSRILQERLESLGIRFRLCSMLGRLNGLDYLESIEIDGQAQGCSLLILAVGVRGNTELARDSGLALGKWGIKVNEYMQTSCPDIYAIGDCVEVKSRIDGRETLMQLAVAAYKQGIVAGNNITGGHRAYRGALNTFATFIGDMEAAATGFTTDDSPESISGKASGSLRPEWCHGKEAITVKLIAGRDGRILGCQAVGKGASERVNIVSACIQAGFSAYDLSETELCYCPAISDTYDVLMQAADNAIRRLEAKK